MKIEQELKTTNFISEQHKAQANVLFSASWLWLKQNQWLKEYDITNEQFNVLRIIRGTHPQALCVRDITERMIDRNSNTTRILDKLVDKRFVSRKQSREDRRELSVSITKAGLQLLERLDKDVESKMFSLVNLSEGEAQLLNALLDKMREERAE